ncbi:CBN-CYP-33C11 protein [Caenorhabditis brenneri]|uniref:CBN-CYP-33C11 protein n=1 Tax=Caenorhabditis brenneri TaxID=135651 RepID=G0NEI6_CAEBE|nr:CBN-CYP-33C11 protein [Caenorhabditis brenneri]
MIISFLVALLILWLFREFVSKRRQYPPGPIPIPFVGNIIPMIWEAPGYECFRRWTKKYGDVYTFWLGPTPYIMIGSYESMKETFVKDGDTYTDKLQMPFTEKFRGGKFGIIETSGHFWSTHRRFAISTLRDFGLGKDLMQQKILLEVEETFRVLDEGLGEEQDVPNVVYNAVANVINQIIFGYRFDESKQGEFQKLKDLIDIQEKSFLSFKLCIQAFAPEIGNWLPGKSLDDIITEKREDYYSFFYSQIDNHRRKINFDTDEVEDYAEAYLKEQLRQEEKEEMELFSDQQLANMCFDLWMAGLTTTNTTLTWTIAYVMNYPEVQEKIHVELDKVIGRDRFVTMANKNSLPYINAVINESQRCVNLLPLNLFHATTKDTVINGYEVKKGTGVIAQISTVMLNENIFPDPYCFNPDRFIDEDGKLKKVDELIPFSIGKRQCLGEGLARMELFLFIANFFNRYKASPSSEGPPSLKKVEMVGVFPRKFKAVLAKRRG